MIPYIHLGTLQIPTYFLVISLSLSFLLLLLSYRVDSFSKDRKLAFDIAILLMISGFVGGRLLHVFYEEWDYYKLHPEQIFYFWNGGFVFLGGLIFCLITGFIFAKLRKINFTEWADFFTPLFSLSHALGRIGCFLSGCCFGSQCALPWAYAGRHPTALYLAIGEFFIFLLLLWVEKKQRSLFVQKEQGSQFGGSLFAKWLLLHSLLRFNVEYFRDDFRGLFFQFPILGSLSISQIISLFIVIGCLVFFYLKKRSTKPDKAAPEA